MRSTVTLRNLDEMWGYEACFRYFSAHGLQDLMPYAKKRMFGKLTGVYYRLPKAARRSEEMKKAKKALWSCVKILRKNRQIWGGEKLKIAVFYRLPSLYAIRVKRLLKR